MTLDEFLPMLNEVRSRGQGRYMARCPAHPDKSPSLSVSEGGRGILLRCFPGCTVPEICAALGLTVGDLFFDSVRPAHLGHRHTPTPPRVARLELAFQFELAALDLRLRAEKIIEAGQALDMAHLSDDKLDRALAHVAQAHSDIVRAEIFEQVADTLRMKEFMEREHEQIRRTA